MNNKHNVLIYKLIDPRFPDTVRYVGKTIRSLNLRLNEHICWSKQNTGKRHVANWIVGLLKNGIKPEIIALEKCDESVWEDREKFYIDFYKKMGHKLTNFEDGGISSMILKDPDTITERLKKTNKEVIQTDMEGNFIKSFDSCSSVEKELGFNKHVVASCCRGKQTKAYGYRWYFKNEPEFSRIKRKHTKEVLVLFKNTGEIKEFSSITDCAHSIGLSRSYITNVINNKRDNLMYKITFKNVFS